MSTATEPAHVVPTALPRPECASIHRRDVAASPGPSWLPAVLPRTGPAALPEDVWAHVLSNKARRGELEPLLACMRFIGSLYAKSDQATELGESVRLDIHTRGDLNPDPALAQCRLLYSIGTYWCGDRDTSRREMDAALGIAIGLGMHCREFTIENSGSGEDPVLAESLRTTW
ncbi:hypothetical protein MCOR30_010873 [Pyricularia oryzae]|nr:hypothetical protein MCOR30_010873 [Pyricularia oryzae]KAI6450094.1 hypothetical protein MCOR15_009530 [Pyricularia oryzae]